MNALNQLQCQETSIKSLARCKSDRELNNQANGQTQCQCQGVIIRPDIASFLCFSKGGGEGENLVSTVCACA